MRSVFLAFNKENVLSYLDRAYAICQGQHLLEEPKGFTVLHICSASVLKAVHQAMLRQTDDKGLVEFATFCFARLQNASTMPEATQVFRLLCVVLTTAQYTKSVQESVCAMGSPITKSNDKPTEEATEPAENKEWDLEEKTCKHYHGQFTLLLLLFSEGVGRG